MLESSGRTVEVEAQEAIALNKFLRSVPCMTIRFLGFSGNGIEGKSSYGTVLTELFPVPLVITRISPVCSRVIFPVSVNAPAICCRSAAGIATTPSVVIFPASLRSMPVSRLVARSFIPSSPAIRSIDERAGSVPLLRSANRAAICTASENSFFSSEIFIRILLGVWVVGIAEIDRRMKGWEGFGNKGSCV
jgi:hypothetical protein